MAREKNEGEGKSLSEARNYLKSLLKHRPRTRQEAEKRLTEKGYEEEVVEEVLDWAEKGDLIDDAAFAQLWIEDRLQHKPKSVSLLRKELLQKGVPKKIVEEKLKKTGAEEGEKSRCRELAQKRVKRYRGEDKESKYRKTLGFLLRRGFPRGLAHRTLKDLLDDE